jgi:hypothetical protein
MIVHSLARTTYGPEAHAGGKGEKNGPGGMQPPQSVEIIFGLRPYSRAHKASGLYFIF